MDQYKEPTGPAGPAGRAHAHPVVALRDQCTQTPTAANRLRSILATVDDPGRRFGSTDEGA